MTKWLAALLLSIFMLPTVGFARDWNYRDRDRDRRYGNHFRDYRDRHDDHRDWYRDHRWRDNWRPYRHDYRDNWRRNRD